MAINHLRMCSNWSSDFPLDQSPNTTLPQTKVHDTNLFKQSQKNAPIPTTSKGVGPSGPLNPVVIAKAMTKAFAMNTLIGD